MKQAIMNARLKFSMLITSLLVSFLAIAQDEKKVDIDINTKGNDSNFLMQPWVWVVGGLVFILLLVALLKNNRNA